MNAESTNAEETANNIRYRVKKTKRFRVKRSSEIEQKVKLSLNTKPVDILSLESLNENIQALNTKVSQLEDKLKWVSA